MWLAPIRAHPGHRVLHCRLLEQAEVVGAPQSCFFLGYCSRANASPPFPLCSWWSVSPIPSHFIPFHPIPSHPTAGNPTVPVPWDSGDLGGLFSSLLLLGLCQRLSLCPNSCIAPEIDYSTGERTISWRKGLSSLRCERSFSSFIPGQASVSLAGSTHETQAPARLGTLKFES